MHRRGMQQHFVIKIEACNLCIMHSRPWALLYKFQFPGINVETVEEFLTKTKIPKKKKKIKNSNKENGWFYANKKKVWRNQAVLAFDRHEKKDHPIKKSTIKCWKKIQSKAWKITRWKPLKKSRCVFLKEGGRKKKRNKKLLLNIVFMIYGLFLGPLCDRNVLCSLMKVRACNKHTS